MSRSRLRADQGFALIELLVAVLIIGILIAIALPAFLGQKTSAQDTSATSVLVTASKAMLTYGTDHDGYADATVSDLTKIEPAISQARNFKIDAQSARAFTVTVQSAAAEGGTFSITRTADGGQVRDCSMPGVGTCRETADSTGNRW